ncbi:metalloendoproteinase 3-MMP-like [Salvia hispanica]|uniref:metalloendoproteinase 3-MMP-like n=1 Tax=Salvia hispanica TaxID=49212 RepID=UPI0020096BB2|nr:metalloendoproteinase 3-MMP-like [Salvia hispanica]
MAIKNLHLTLFTFLVFLLIFAIGEARRVNTKNILIIGRASNKNKTTSSFDFIKKLQGCRKGSNEEGIQQLKTYLEKFGYLENQNQPHPHNDHFDETLESAIKTYQQNYHLKPTGTLDPATISKLTAPRCGVADITNGTNHMRQHHVHEHGSITMSHYSFFSGQPKWSNSKTHLIYGLSRNIPAVAIPAIESAFQKWASVSSFSFSRGWRYVDLIIGFKWRDHNDGSPFDGPHGVLAHAFPPTDGRLHLDGDELWSIGAVSDAIDLESVVLHEIGHLLGLGHSDNQESIMYPSISSGVVKNNLNDDDIQGIQALYN